MPRVSQSDLWYTDLQVNNHNLPVERTTHHWLNAATGTHNRGDHSLRDRDRVTIQENGSEGMIVPSVLTLRLVSKLR